MTLKADKYYGQAAKGYEKTRAKSPKWAAEDKAFRSLVKSGPVLDAPVGTGRFIPWYLERGIKYVGADISGDMIAQARKKDASGEFVECSVHDLPFEDGQFEHVVCSRLAHWLKRDDWIAAMREMQRVGRVVDYSIRVGERGHGHNYQSWTHAEDDNLDALNGWMITHRTTVAERNRCRYDVIQCRKPNWNDVLDQFRDRPKDMIQRLINEWAPRVGLEPFKIGGNPVRCEYWTGEQHHEMIEYQATFDPRARTTKPPRRDYGPITIVEKGGHRGMIDGRHRSQLRKSLPGRFPVLIVEC